MLHTLVPCSRCAGYDANSSESWVGDEGETPDHFQELQNLAADLSGLLWVERFQILSSALNLIIIVTFGCVYPPAENFDCRLRKIPHTKLSHYLPLTASKPHMIS